MFNLTQKQIESFKWRVWNTFKSTILPVAAVTIYARLSQTEGQIDILGSWELWEAVIYAVLISLLGSLVAGVDKVKRM